MQQRVERAGEELGHDAERPAADLVGVRDRVRGRGRARVPLTLAMNLTLPLPLSLTRARRSLRSARSGT